MNQDQMKGKMDQFTGKIKETWGKMTDDDVALYSGKRDQFLGKLQERHGLAKEEAEKQLKKLEDSYHNSSDKAA